VNNLVCKKKYSAVEVSLNIYILNKKNGQDDRKAVNENIYTSCMHCVDDWTVSPENTDILHGIGKIQNQDLIGAGRTILFDFVFWLYIDCKYFKNVTQPKMNPPYIAIWNPGVRAR